MTSVPILSEAIGILFSQLLSYGIPLRFAYSFKEHFLIMLSNKIESRPIVEYYILIY